MMAAGADIGGTLGAGGGAVVALPTGELAAPLTVAGGAALGAAGGAALGKWAGHALTNVLFSQSGGSGGASEESDGGLGAWSRSNRLNATSPTTQNLFNSRGMKVTDFISKFRKGSIREVFPSEFLDKTVDEALQSGGSTIRKLLVDNRFMR